MDSIKLDSLDKSNWKSFRFDEIAKNVSERVDPTTTDLKVYIGLEHVDAETVHIKRTGTPDEVKGQKLKGYPGDVIFGKRRAYQRKAAILTDESVCSAHAFILRPIPEVIDSKLFPFFLHSDLFMHRMVDISVGGLSPTINWGILKSQEFLLPPKEQQTELAELLWSMDEVIEKELRVLETLDIQYQTFTKNFFNENMKLEIADLPVGWRIQKLKNICSLIKDGTHGTHKNQEQGVALLSAKDIKNGEIEIDNDPRLISEEEFNKIHKRYELSDKDLLVTIVGTIGNIAIIEDYKRNFTFQRSVGILRAHREYNPDFLYHYFQSIFFQKELQRKTVTSVQSGVYLEELANSRVILPDSTSEEKFIEVSSSTKASKAKITRKVDSSKSLQRSLINQVF